MPSGRSFHALAGQDHHTGFDLLELALLQRGQGWKRLATLAPPTVRTHLHAQHGAIYTQHHHRWCVLGGGAFTATVGMVVAQPCTIATGRLA